MITIKKSRIFNMKVQILLFMFCISTLNVFTQTSVSSGNVSGTWTHTGSPYLIQGSIIIANGTTLSIEPGVTVNFQGTYKMLVLGRIIATGTSADSITFTASNTTNGWRGIRFDNTSMTNDSSKFSFCRFQYGKATGSSPDDNGGALYFNNFSKTIISNCHISNCKANSGGGGIYCSGSSPIINNNTINNNTSTIIDNYIGGGGIYCTAGSNSIISNNRISNNTAFYGGGIYCNNSNPSITNNIITNNSVGGIFSNNSSPSITKNIITYNVGGSPSGGGGITNLNSKYVISDNIISNNSGSGIASVGSNSNNSTIISNTISKNSGGGIYFSSQSDQSSLDVSNNTITYNTSSGQFSEGGGGIFCWGNGTISISNNSVLNNSTSFNGGGIYCLSNSPTISNNVLANNSANSGGAIYCNGSSPTIINATLVNNSAVNGGALYCEQTSIPIIYNSILWGNTAKTKGSQVFLNDEASDPNISYCDIQCGSSAFELNGNFFTGNYSNNLNIDPKFVLPTSGSGISFNGVTADWSLQNTSFCIDAGDNTKSEYTTTDIAGHPRVNICRIDMGAYEYQEGIPLTGSLELIKPILCSGNGTGEISFNVSGGTLPYLYHWSNGQTNAIATGLVAGNYTVTVTEANGCTLTKSITLNQPPVIIENAGVDKTSICGSTVQLNSLTTNYSGNGPLKYKWTPSTGLNNDTIANPTATVTSNVTYTVTVTTPDGCTASDEMKVNVNPLTANAGADKTGICGGMAQLNSVTTNYSGLGILKYKWTPSTGLNNDTIANPTATVTSNVTYTVTVTTPDGCTATDDVAVTIIPMAKPEIGMVGVSNTNKNLIAWNKPVSAGVESYYIYRETNVTNVYEKIGTVPYDSLSIFVDNQSFPDVQSNKYKLSIYDRCGLESPLSNYHKTMHLAINKGIGTTWNLSWEAYEGFIVSTYNIYRGTTQTNLTFLGSTSGSNTQYNDLNAPSGDIYYQLEIISPNYVHPTKAPNSLQNTKDEGNGLSNSLLSYTSSRSNIATNIVNGNNELGETKINIYPNPVKKELRVTFEGGSTFEILNMMGQVIYNGNLIKSSIVQTSNLSSGIYLIKFKIGKTFEYRKIIKE